MNRQLKPTDLCVNCVHLGACAFAREHARPIIFCEEFLFEEFQRQLGSQACENRMASPAPDCGELCINCDHTRSCVLIKTDNGQIYCEEYK